MKRILILVWLFSSTLVWGQSTSVTLSVIDTDGQAWSNGTWSVQLTIPVGGGFNPNSFKLIGTNTSVPNQQQSGSLNATGGASLSVTPNASIGGASVWNFNVCDQGRNKCVIQQVTINGASQTVTLNPSAIRISMTNPPPLVAAYADIELVSPSAGQQYFNLTSLSQRQWNGSIWISVSSGGTAIYSSPLTFSTTGHLDIQIPNDPTTGTVVNQLVCKTGVGNAIVCPAGSINGIIGSCFSNCGTAASFPNANVTILGIACVSMDTAASVNDFIQGSPTTIGLGHDAGVTFPSNGSEVIGAVASSTGICPGGVTQIFMTTPDTAATNGSANIQSGAAGQIPYYAVAGQVLAPDTRLTDSTTALNYSGAGGLSIASNSANRPQGCVGITGCISGAEASVVGTPVSGEDRFRWDSTAHAPLASYNGDTEKPLPRVIASGTSTLAASLLTTGTCASVITTAATGAATTDAIEWSFASAASTVDGRLNYTAWTTSANVNFQVCNGTAGSLTPTGLVVNWRVIR